MDSHPKKPNLSAVLELAASSALRKIRIALIAGFPAPRGFKDNIPHYYTYWSNLLKALYTLRKEKLYCPHHGDPKGRDELPAGGFCGAEFIVSPQFPSPHLQNSHHRALYNIQFWWGFFSPSLAIGTTLTRPKGVCVHTGGLGRPHSIFHFRKQQKRSFYCGLQFV